MHCGGYLRTICRREVAELDREAVERLLCAVVLQAVKDYKSALYNYSKARGRGKKIEYRSAIGECELFFTQNIRAYCNVDGQKIMKKAREDVREKLEKENLIMRLPR